MSLTIGMWAALFLLISDGSMSMWTILPCLANSDTLPVTRSSNRTPKASSKSASFDGVVRIDAAVHAEHVERQRIVGRECAQAHHGRGDGNAWSCATSSRSSSLASPVMTPPPA